MTTRPSARVIFRAILYHVPMNVRTHPRLRARLHSISTRLLAAACALSLLASCTQPAPQPSSPSSSRTPSSQIPRMSQGLDPAQLGIGQAIANLRVTTLAGATLSLDDLLRDRRAIVIAMASAECPLAIEYAPRLAAIERDFEGQVAFLHVNAVDGESLDVIRAMIDDSGLRGSYARDSDTSVRLELKPKTTTEVFVLNASRTLLYRGAIDDQYRLGGKATRIQRNFLRDALRDVIAGTAPDPAATSAPGCLIDMPRLATRQASQSPSIPFYPRVADVLERNCIQCHQPGGAAPFSLASPASVEGRSAMIAAVVREGIMPPNHGLSWTGSKPMVHDRAMSREDRDLLLAWLASDRTSSSSLPADATPTPSSRTSSRVMGRDNLWSIGTPDYMAITPGPTLNPQDVATPERYFIPINLDADAWVEAIECRPVMRDSVAVAQVWLVTPGQPLPALNAFPASDQLFATFSRSDRVVDYGPDAARLLPARAILVVDLLGRAMSQTQPSQLRIAMRFAKEPPSREIRTRILSLQSQRAIPPGAIQTLDADLSLPVGTRIIALRPLMGPRVQSLRMDLRQRGTAPRELIDLHRYDWRWLIRYPLLDPIALESDARIEAQWLVNNSAENPVNPDPTQVIRLGVGDAHEQLGVAIEYTIDRAEQPE